MRPGCSRACFDRAAVHSKTEAQHCEINADSRSTKRVGYIGLRICSRSSGGRSGEQVLSRYAHAHAS